MPRVLLVSYTANEPAAALRLRRRLDPKLHVELGAAHRFPSGTVVAPADLLTPSERAKTLEDGIAWLRGIPRLPVKDGIVANALMHRSVSLWWWLESPFWFGNPVDPSFPPMSELLESLEALRAAMEAVQYDRVAFASDLRPMVSLVVRDLCDHFGLPFSGRSIASRSLLPNYLRPHLMRLLLRRRRKLGGHLEARHIRVLLISHLNTLRPAGGRLEDVYLGPLAKELTARKVPHAICYVNSTADAHPRLRSPYPELPQGGFLLEQAIGRAPANEIARTYRGVLASWRRVEPSLLPALVWRGIELRRTLKNRLGEAIRRHGPSGMYYLSAFGEILRGWKPELAVITNETGYFGRAAVAACRQTSVRSLGLQHGLISPQHIEYIKDSESMNRRELWSCPFPDLTALDGRYYQRVLTEVGAYPESATVVTGQMRYEAGNERTLDSVQRIPTRIVVATQPFDRERWMKDVLDACQDMGDVTIKPHPLENKLFYENLVSSLSARATVATDVDLMLLLHSAGVLVTQFSTTIVEAALAGCPCIIYNPQGRPAPIPFVELGGAWEARSLADLRRLIASATGREADRKRLAEMRVAFLSEFAFGGATGSAQRLADLIPS